MRLQQEVTVGDPATGTGSVVGEEVYIRALPGEGPIQDVLHGRELWFAYGALGGVNGAKANGVATAHYLQDGTYVLSLQLNIQNPDEGEFYEAWLFPEGGGAAQSAGHLVQGERDGRQILTFRSAVDLRRNLRIVISRENDDGNPAMGQRVTEGDLRVTKR